MSKNLIEQIQEKLQFPALQKVDANTEEVKYELHAPNENRFCQAAIPTVLVGLATFTRHNKEVESLSKNLMTNQFMDLIFGEAKAEVINKVADYSKYSYNEAETVMNVIAKNAIEFMNDALKEDRSEQQIINFFEEQKNNFLTYLPNELKIGQSLNNDIIDDDTHKMEGPISSIMHALSNTFSTTEITKK